MKKFFEFNVGQVISVAIWLVTIGIFFGTLKSVISRHDEEIGEIRKIQKEIIEKVSKIDSTGGTAMSTMKQDIELMKVSLQQLVLEQARNGNLAPRVSKLEEYIPKIDILNVKVDWIKENLAAKNKESER